MSLFCMQLLSSWDKICPVLKNTTFRNLLFLSFSLFPNRCVIYTECLTKTLLQGNRKVRTWRGGGENVSPAAPWLGQDWTLLQTYHNFPKQILLKYIRNLPSFYKSGIITIAIIFLKNECNSVCFSCKMLLVCPVVCALIHSLEGGGGTI